MTVTLSASASDWPLATSLSAARNSKANAPQAADVRNRTFIIGGPANGGPLEKEVFGEKFSLYSWSGDGANLPAKLIDNLRPYTVRPEGIDLIEVAGQWRVIFVEDRVRAIGYATRNAVHWPLAILGGVE